MNNRHRHTRQEEQWNIKKILANAGENEANSAHLSQNLLNSGCFSTILHRNSGKLSSETVGFSIQWKDNGTFRLLNPDLNVTKCYAKCYVIRHLYLCSGVTDRSIVSASLWSPRFRNKSAFAMLILKKKKTFSSYGVTVDLLPMARSPPPPPPPPPPHRRCSGQSPLPHDVFSYPLDVILGC
jgi:hypothetical protein